MSELANLYNALRNRTNLNAKAEAERKRVREQQRIRQEQKDAKRHAEKMGQLQLLGQIGGAALGAAYLPGAGLATNAASGALMGSSLGSAGAGLAAAFTPNILGTQPDADNPYYAPVSQTQATSQAIGAGLSAWSSYEQAKALKNQQNWALKMKNQVYRKLDEGQLTPSQLLDYVAPQKAVQGRQVRNRTPGGELAVTQGKSAMPSQLMQDLGIRTEADLMGLSMDDANMLAMGVGQETIETILPLADVYKSHTTAVALEALITSGNDALELRAELKEYLDTPANERTPEWVAKQSPFIQEVHKVPPRFRNNMYNTIVTLANETVEEQKEQLNEIKQNRAKSIREENKEFLDQYDIAYTNLQRKDPDEEVLVTEENKALIASGDIADGRYNSYTLKKRGDFTALVDWLQASRSNEDAKNYLAVVSRFTGNEDEVAKYYMAKYGATAQDIENWKDAETNPKVRNVDDAKRRANLYAAAPGGSRETPVAKSLSRNAQLAENEQKLAELNREGEAATEFIEKQPTLSTKPTVEQPVESEAEVNVKEAEANADQDPITLLQTKQKLADERIEEQGANIETTVGEKLTAARATIDELTAMTRSEYATYLKNVDNDQLYNEHKKVENGQREHVERYKNDAELRGNREQSEFWITQGTILRTRLEQVEQEMRSRDLEPPVSEEPQKPLEPERWETEGLRDRLGYAASDPSFLNSDRILELNRQSKDRTLGTNIANDLLDYSDKSRADANLRSMYLGMDAENDRKTLQAAEARVKNRDVAAAVVDDNVDGMAEYLRKKATNQLPELKPGSWQKEPEPQNLQTKIKMALYREGIGNMDDIVDSLIAVESDGDNVTNRKSSASGILQITQDTAEKYLDEGVDLSDPDNYTRAAVALLKDNASILEGKYPVTALNMYVLHHFGPGGLEILKANRDFPDKPIGKITYKEFGTENRKPLFDEGKIEGNPWISRAAENLKVSTLEMPVSELMKVLEFAVKTGDFPTYGAN